MSKRKMSKRYPHLKRWIEGLPINRPNGDGVGPDGGEYEVNTFYGKLQTADWLHVNKDITNLVVNDGVDKYLNLSLYLNEPLILTFNRRDSAKGLVFICEGGIHLFRNRGKDMTFLTFVLLLQNGDFAHGRMDGSKNKDLEIYIYPLTAKGNFLDEKERAEIGKGVKVAIASTLLVKNVIPEKKIKKIANKRKDILCRYEKINDLPINVDFINIGRLSGSASGKPFSVAGHPRLQRVGKGRKEVKVVWVKPHVRGGRKSKPYKELKEMS